MGKPGTKPIPVAIVGASGYTGEMLLRLLAAHPSVALTCVTSRENAGRRIGEVFPRFAGTRSADLAFIEPNAAAIAHTGAQAAFLALPHGVAAPFAPALLEKGLRVVDLSADFRLRCARVYEEFYGEVHPEPALLPEAVYGLPEAHGDAIREARLVAAPGCYPTSILLPLLPLVREGLVDPASIVVTSMSGVSGAGRKAAIHLLFVECNESVRPYGVPAHRHLSEIEQELGLAADEEVKISFTPHLVPVNSGICSSITALARAGVDAAALGAAYATAYGDAPFVRLLGEHGCPDTKHVTGTNFIDIGWFVDGRTGRCVLLSAIDNLGKGAASQAVQCFNLMFGLDERSGLVV